MTNSQIWPSGDSIPLGDAILFADGAGTIRRCSRAAHRSGRKLYVELTFALLSHLDRNQRA